MDLGQVDNQAMEVKSVGFKENYLVDSEMKPPDPSVSNWKSNLANSDPEFVMLECANQLYFGHWELFKCLATTLIDADKHPFDKQFILNLLKSFYNEPQKYCKGSATIEIPQQFYWLSAQFYAEICDDKKEAKKHLADAGFRLLLSEIYTDDVKDALAELYLLFRSYANGTFDTILSAECQTLLVELLASNTALGCAILDPLVRLERPDADRSHLSQLLSCLHDGLDRCLTKLDLDSGSTFRSNSQPEDMAAVKSSVYRLLLLGGAMAALPASNNDDRDGLTFTERQTENLQDKRNQQLVVRLQQFCERGILDMNTVFSLCLSHGGDLWLVRSLCHLEDQSRNRIEVADAAVSAANFLHLVRDRASQLNVREMFLHSVLNGSHFLERIVGACVELIDSGDSLLACCTLQDHLLCRLKPLVLLVAWTRVKSVTGISRFLDAHELLFSGENKDGGDRTNFDPTLVTACDQLARKARLVLSTMSNDLGSRKRSKVQRQNVLDVLPGLTRMSALYVLSRCTSVAGITREQAFEALKMCASPDEDVTLSGVSLRDEVVLLSYYLMCDLSRVIGDGITLDHMMGRIRGPATSLPLDISSEDAVAIESADAKKFYKENIVKQLDAIGDTVAKIFPLDYRVEILENAFALLFATHRHVKEGNLNFGESSESSDDGGLEDEHPVRGRRVSATRDAAAISHTDTRSSTVTQHLLCRGTKEEPESKGRKETWGTFSNKKTRNSRVRRFASVVPAHDVPTHHFTPSSGGNSSARSTSSGSHGLSRIGFVANELVTRDLLDCLRRCVEKVSSLVTTAAAKCGDDPPESWRNLQRRLIRLSEYVSEGQWRFQLVVSEGTPKKYGVFPAFSCKRQPAGMLVGENGDWSWNFYSDPRCAESDGDAEAKREPGKSSATAAKPTRKASLGVKRRSTDMASRGIINRMLAPHESLLNMCLHQNQFVKAQQVIKVFGMEKTARSSEIEFSVAYERTLRRLLKLGSATSPVGTSGGRAPVRSPSMSSGVPRSPWESILDAAQFGAEVATSSESLAIDELLASHNVPSVSEWDALTTKVGEGQISSSLPGLPERLDWRSLVKADLAVVGCTRPSVVRGVLESCRGALWSGSATNSSLARPLTTSKRDPSAHGRLSRQKPASPRGMWGFLENLTLLATSLSEIATGDAATPTTLQSLNCASVRDLLLQATWPLSYRQFKVTTATWKRLASALEQFQGLAWKEEIALAASPSESAAASLSSSPKVKIAGSPGLPVDVVPALSGERHPLNAAYQKLMRLTSVARLMLADEENDSYNGSAPKRIPVYMFTLYEYIKNIHSFLPRFQSELSTSVPRSYFSAFGQSPSTILKQLLFDTSVAPSELEDFARHLNLNLLQVVVQHSCPYISAIGNLGGTDHSSDASLSLDGQIRISSSPFESMRGQLYLSLPLWRSRRVSIGSFISCDLESVVLSPVLLEYVRGHCWLAALVMQELGCASRVPPGESSSKTSSLLGSNEVQTEQHHLIDHPILHRFLHHRRRGAHCQKTHNAAFSFQPSVSADHATVALDEYVQTGDWFGMIEYASDWECQGDKLATCRDEVMGLMVKFTGCSRNERAQPWLYALKIRDGRLRAEMVLTYFHAWTAEDAVAALSACTSEGAIVDELRHKAKFHLSRVQLFQDILEAGLAKKDARRWQDVQQDFDSSPLRPLNDLAALERYDIIVRWCKLHKISKDLQPICRESSVLALLGTSNCAAATLQRALEDTFDVGQRFSICQKMLVYFSGKPEQASSLLAVLESCDLTGIDNEQVKLFTRKKIGHKILSCLRAAGDKDSGRYVCLVEQPHLMIEQLLMGFKIETIQRVYHNIREDLRAFSGDEFLSFEALDRLVELYASAAIDFRIVKTPTHLVVRRDENVEPTRRTSLTEKSVKDFVVPTRKEWVPDSASEWCSVCVDERFSMFNRRHHCRRCGRVVCGNCSQQKGLVDGYGDVMVRICDDCYIVAFDSTPKLAGNIDSVNAWPSETLDQRLRSHFEDKTSSIAAAAASPCRPRARNESSLPACCTLSLDEAHNRTAREEFSYDQAPNISLCLSILELHWDQRKSADYLIHLAETLFTFLQPVSPGVANPEVDYALVISLLRTVFLSSRVKFSKLPDNDRDASVHYCDLCLSLTDLLQLLVNANCKHLIPVGDYTNAKAVSQSLLRLRDQLIKEERWDLALEVSTKGGMSVAGVWTAWGMANLKFGAYASARQKFSHCLPRPVDAHKPAPGATLLGQIIQRLERQSSNGVFSVATANSVRRLRSRLKTIKSGILISSAPDPNHRLTADIRDECLHYIVTYGAHDTALAFLIRQNDYENALRYIISEKCLPAMFVEQVAVPSLRRGTFHLVRDAVAVVDKSLELLGVHFGALCRHLERQGWLHTLYGVQLFLKDHVRAAISCILFYQRDARDYNDLFDRLPHLVNARHHLQTYKQQPQGQAGKKPIMHATSSEIDRYLRSIALQDEVTKFLYGRSSFWQATLASDTSDAGSMASVSMSRESVPLKEACALPTVFHDAVSRAKVVAMVILAGVTVAEGFELGDSIVQEFRLRAHNVFSLVAKRLMQQQRTPEVGALVSCMREMAGQSSETCDQVLLRSISLAITCGCDTKDIETLIRHLTNENSKIDAQIQCGKLKSAYLLAVKMDSGELIQRIMKEAERTGQPSVKHICEKWMSRKENN